jgi:DNA-binding NtrC family response regulator
MAKSARALAVFSDHDSREAIFQILTACGIESIFCSTIGEARMMLRSEGADIVFCETSFADGSFENVLRARSSGEPIPPVLVCSRLYGPAVYLAGFQRNNDYFAASEAARMAPKVDFSTPEQ